MTVVRDPYATENVVRQTWSDLTHLLRIDDDFVLESESVELGHAAEQLLVEAEDVAHWWQRAATWPGEGEALPPFVHVLTHVDWTLSPLRWPSMALTPASACATGWQTPHPRRAGPLPKPSLPR